MKPDAERDHFELWAEADNMDLAAQQYEDGSDEDRADHNGCYYVSEATNCAFIGWRARAAQPPVQQTEDHRSRDAINPSPQPAVTGGDELQQPMPVPASVSDPRYGVYLNLRDMVKVAYRYSHLDARLRRFIETNHSDYLATFDETDLSPATPQPLAAPVGGAEGSIASQGALRTADAATVSRDEVRSPAGHTSGSWFWARDSHNRATNLMRSGTGDYVLSPQADLSDYALSVDRYVDATEDDLRLCESAPDLLDALKACRTHIAGYNLRDGSEARALIDTLFNELQRIHGVASTAIVKALAPATDAGEHR